MKKIKRELTLEEAWGYKGLMATSAFRYCLGRMTYIVGDCADWITTNWEKFPQNVKNLIERELEEEFERDDRERKHREEFPNHEHTTFGFPLGHDCDRKEWERVRGLWNK